MTPSPSATTTPLHTHEVIIIGSGFAGIGMAIRLQQEGIDDFVMLERGDTVGGTWRDNHYPGAACDVVSHVYSLSFEPKADWSRTYGQQHEIQGYLESTAAKHDLHRRLRFGQQVTEAAFDEATATWTVTTSAGDRFRATTLVLGVGALKDPAWARLPGIEDFAGPQMHSAMWDHDLDLTGKRVGVIGTGASAIQFVPEIAPVAGRTTVFQRTAPWVVPKGERSFLAVEKLAFRMVPGLRRAVRLREYLAMEATYKLFFETDHRLTGLGQHVLRQFIRTEVRDPELREKVTPDITLGCKRVLKSNDWYPALSRDDVDLETRSIARVVPDGVELDDGTKVELDVLVHGTGFSVDEPLGSMRVTGRGGVDLAEVWGNRPTAYLGSTIPGFPNAFMLGGPNTGLGHNSMVFMLEQAIEYALEAVKLLRTAPDPVFLEVDRRAHDDFVAEVDRRHVDAVWASGCKSWYLNEDGQNFTLWPGSTLEFRRRARRFDVAAYTLHKAVGARELVAV